MTAHGGPAGVHAPALARGPRLDRARTALALLGRRPHVEYRAAPGSVARWLPDGVEPVEEDPDAVALIWADWQSCSDGGAELLDPVRSQYKEASSSCGAAAAARRSRGAS